LEEGGFWMQKQHIFLFPFYYIDYAMAQMCAFEFYTKMKKDRQGTWEDYCRLCSIGGRLGYFDTLKYANLHSPLEQGAVANATAGVFEDLGL
ncbi:MAG: M3 family oligoendopeptidase, partial [Firmicutes bacterium]|nr:M3 family oligoendopeptidase [Bacillota bacterium]